MESRGRGMYKKGRIFILLTFILFYPIPAGAVEKGEGTWEKEIVYFILVDRFFDGNSANNGDADVNNPNTFNGGDFAGVTTKLDYLKNMGFTTIILSPIFENEKDGYHGNWIYNFYHTDSHFGTLAEFKRLVNEAHKRDMKVMIDFVANHVGRNHPWLNDSSKKDWFHKKKVMNQGNDKKIETAWINGLPDLKQENSEVESYLLDVAKWWINETDVDGYRLDQMQYVGINFWKNFVLAVRAENPDFYLIGNAKDVNMKTIENYRKIGIDAYMDYMQNEALRKAFAAPNSSLTDIFSKNFKRKDIYNRLPEQINFMDTSQLKRFTFDATKANQNPGTRWKMALSFLYTTPGFPVILYGSEIALNGGKPPENHQLMNFKTDQDLVEYMTQLAQIRTSHPALSHGKMNILFDSDGMTIFKRTLGAETIVVAINNTSKTQAITLHSSFLVSNKELRGLLNGDLVRSKGDTYKIVLDREQAEIYTLTNKSTINIPYFIVLFFVLAVFALFIVLVIKRSEQKKD